MIPDNNVKSMLSFSVKRYDYIVNGEALKEIQDYIKYDHTFAEYQKVSKFFPV